MSFPTPPVASPKMLDQTTPSPRLSATRWSVVARAAQSGNVPERETARDLLCRTYWYPLFVFLRRKGHSATHAEDLVQGFFLQLFEKDLLAAADPLRGRFRTYLLTSLSHFAAHDYRDQQALKRGGTRGVEPLDTSEADRRYLAMAARDSSPESAFERAWAVTLLEAVLAKLQAEYSDNAAFFAALRPYLTTDTGQLPYADTARQLGISALNIKVSVHRLRARYRRLLDQQLLSTVEDPADLDEERAALFRALSQ